MRLSEGQSDVQHTTWSYRIRNDALHLAQERPKPGAVAMVDSGAKASDPKTAVYRTP